MQAGGTQYLSLSFASRFGNITQWGRSARVHIHQSFRAAFIAAVKAVSLGSLGIASFLQRGLYPMLGNLDEQLNAVAAMRNDFGTLPAEPYANTS